MRLQQMAGFSLLILGAALGAHAQDTRTVTEPNIPANCVVLHAEKLDPAAYLGPQFDSSTDTARIQDALDHCTPGHAVELASGSLPQRPCNAPTLHLGDISSQCATGEPVPYTHAFLTGSLELREGVTLLIDKGVTLYGSRDPKDYDPDPADTKTKLLCGTMSDVSRVYITAKDAASGKTMPPPPAGRGCKPLISINVKNAAIMGEGTIDGRGGAVVLGHDYTWWQMARAAEPKQLAYYTTRLIVANHADGLILYGIHLNNSPNFHVAVSNTDGFTAWGVHLQTPTMKGPGSTKPDARNTDGIDPGSSSNITIAHSWIDNGDDNVAIKANVQHVSVLDNHFYNGHGMSIGSDVAGVAYLLVDGLTEDHTTSGIRIKSNAAKGGPVHDVTYRNICMTHVQIPISISPYYNNGTIEGFTDPGVVGDHIPDYKKILLENIYDETPGDVLIAGKDDAHRTEVELSNVQIPGLTDAQVHLAYVDLTIFGFSNNALSYDLKPEEHKTVELTLAANVHDLKGQDPDACAGKFVPYQ